MTTFVCVHGAWVGEHCFDPIVPLLEKAGHQVHLVALSGHGSKAHLSSPDVTLDTHIDDAVAYIKGEKLTRFTLIGHSYGGNIITGVWDLLRNSIEHLIYIDAAIPEVGKSHFDQLGSDLVQQRIELATRNGGMIPFPSENIERRRPERWAQMKKSVQPQSLKTMTTPFRLRNGPLPIDTPRTFILCTRNESYHKRQAAEIRDDPQWRYFEMETRHNAMAEDPEGLVEILLNGEE